MICMPWNGFCMIRVGEQLPDGLTRDVRSLRWSVMVKWPPTPQKIEKNKFVLKCILGHFQWFEQYLFLVENRPIRPPPPLVENSPNFFFNPSLRGGGGQALSGKFHYFFLKPSLINTDKMTWTRAKKNKLNCNIIYNVPSKLFKHLNRSELLINLALQLLLSLA